ncbi:BREX system ATP-binding domain-containing protein [Streptomyces sp. NPDC052236]|uniref:helix-turn-helix transcriptional regulator n=1 Tax=Streptomyces sp. NPDC052236 TaxID=3365686 RepID=UPI0037D0FF99
MTHQLRGREAEERQITHMLHTVAAGAGAVLHVEGGWGSGRTRLLREAADAARRRGFTVLDDHWPPGAEPAALVGARAWRGPVLVVLDDLHHADPAFVRSLCTLVSRLRDRPLAWVLSRRRHAGGPAADRLFAQRYPTGGRLDLRPLSARAGRLLAADYAADCATGAVGGPADLLRATGGNPLLTVELAQAVPGRAPHSSTAGPPSRVRACVQRCMEELSGICRQLLQVGAVLGVSFALSDVTRMLDRPAAELLVPVEEALAADILACVGDRLIFRQELFWHCVLASMPQPARTAMEQEAALLFSARDGAALPGPPSRATAPRQNAVVLRPVEGAVAPRWPQPQPRPGPPDAAQARVSAAVRSILQGRPREAWASATQLMGDFALSPETKDTATAAALIALSLLDAEEAAREAQDILGDGGHPAVSAAALMARTVLADQAWSNGELEEGLRLAHAATQPVRTATPALWRLYPRLALAQKLTDVREFAHAHSVLEQARQDMHQDMHQDMQQDMHQPVRQPVHRPVRPEAEAAVAIVASRLHLHEGRLSPARQEAERALQWAHRAQMQPLLPPALSVLAMIALRTDDLPAAAAYVHQCRSLLDAGVAAPRSAQYAWAELLLAAEQEGPEAARALFSQRFPCQSVRLLFAEEAWAGAWLVRQALAMEDHKGARTLSAHVSRLAAENPGAAVLTAGAQHAQALIDQDTGTLTRIAEQHPDPWTRAWAMEDLGSLPAPGSGADDAPAHKHLTLAHAAFNRLGARRDAARVHERIQALGTRPAAPAAPAAPAGPAGPAAPAGLVRRASGWEELSDTERTVAHLAGQGLTNRQIATHVFRSPHTVNFHLRGIFRKLGIRSRIELARMTPHYPPERAPAEETMDTAG